jgi:hypothetical protein
VPTGDFKEVALKGLVVEDNGRIVEEVHRHRDLGLFQMQLDLVVIDHFNAALVQVSAHQAQDGGLDVLGQPLVDGEDCTSSAVKSSPLFQVTPLRRLKVQVLRSSEAFQLSAR